MLISPQLAFVLAILLSFYRSLLIIEVFLTLKKEIIGAIKQI